MVKELVTQEELKTRLNYDPATGIFTYIKRCNTRTYAGYIPHLYDKDGYLKITIAGRGYRAHRLAWLYVYGKWPEGQIDHKNGTKHDNRIINLRQTDAVGNGRNKRASKKSQTGVRGVCWDSANKRYKASGFQNKRQVHLGYFKTLEDAKKARYLFAKRTYGDFFCE